MRHPFANVAESNLAIAEALAASHRGQFSGLVVRKRGKMRGRGDNRKVYDDDLVHVVLITGFNYAALVERSLERLNTLNIHDLVRDVRTAGLYGWEGKGANRTERRVNSNDLFIALQEQRASFERTLEGLDRVPGRGPFETLRVDGKWVRGVRVYVGEPRRPSHREEPGREFGSIYLQALKIAERVIEPAANGPAPAAKSHPVSVAKQHILERLPMGRYAQYILKSGDDFILRVGGGAHLAATADGIEVRPSTIEEIFGQVA